MIKLWYLVLGIILLLVIIIGKLLFQKKNREMYLPIHQGIVQKYGTMDVRDLESIILKQYRYFYRKNKKTPLFVKCNMIIIMPIYFYLVRVGIIKIQIDFSIIFLSVFFLLSFCSLIVDIYMYRTIPQNYVDSFWEKYLSENEDNKLMVVVHYAYSPKQKSRLYLLSFVTGVLFMMLLYFQFFWL